MRPTPRSCVRDNPYPDAGEPDPAGAPDESESGASELDAAESGLRRPLTADAADIARWVDQGRQMGRETESARNRLQTAAQQRQALLARLHAVDMSHREIADSLGLSPTVIAHAPAEARR